MKRNGNFYYHFRAEHGKLAHRGKIQASAPKIKFIKINGVETTANLTNKVIDFKITQEGLRMMRLKSFVIIGEHRVWTPSRIAKFAHRVQVMNIGERIEATGKNASRRQGNIKF